MLYNWKSGSVEKPRRTILRKVLSCCSLFVFAKQLAFIFKDWKKPNQKYCLMNIWLDLIFYSSFILCDMYHRPNQVDFTIILPFNYRGGAVSVPILLVIQCMICVNCAIYHRCVNGPICMGYNYKYIYTIFHVQDYKE